MMVACVFGERYAGDGGLPALMQTPDTRGDAARMPHDATAAGVNEIERAERAVRVRCLQSRLPGGEDRHDLAAAVRWREHRCQALARRGDHRLVALAEFVAQAVDVHVVDARQPPELLPGDEA